MIPKKFKNIKICFLSTGIGAGSKLLQSYIDGSREILMIPSYILMYLYPNWILWKKENKITTWSKCLSELLIRHPSLLDTAILPGSSDLNKLGNSKKEKIFLKKSEFFNKFMDIADGEKINFKNFLLIIHLAYAICAKQNINEKKLLFYHAHDPDYINAMLKIFPKGKVISMYRDIRKNLPGRVSTSLNKINSKYLNKTDVFFMNINSYQKSLYRNYIGIESIKTLNFNNHKVVSFDDLIKNKEKTVKKVFIFLELKFDAKINLRQTFLNYQWNSEFYKPKKKKIKRESTNFFYFWELIWMKYLYSKFLKKYDKEKINFINLFFLFPLIFLPSKYEVLLIKKTISLDFIKSFFLNVFKECNSNSNKIYEKWGYYEFKWYSKNYPFKFKNFFLKKISSKDNKLVWKILYILIKIFEFLFYPLLISFNYILRVINCFKFLLFNLSEKHLPKKIF